MNKVLVVDFRPDGIKKWNPTNKLVGEYVREMFSLSGGILQYEVVESRTCKGFPVLHAYKQYNALSYSNAIDDDSTAIRKDGRYPMMNYEWFLKEFNILEDVNNGEYDEVWMFGGPLMGFYESRMVGETAYWCNSGGMIKPSRNFVIMGFNYERDVRQMLHSFCHRVESILGKKYCALEFIRKIYRGEGVRTSLLREFPKWIAEHGTAHHSHIGAASYTQDEYAWLGALKPRWWKVLRGT